MRDLRFYPDIQASDLAWDALQLPAAYGTWLKLSGWNRLLIVAPYRTSHDPAQRVAQRLGKHLVWGSNWPHNAFVHNAMPPFASVSRSSILSAMRAAIVHTVGALLNT